MHSHLPIAYTYRHIIHVCIIHTIVLGDLCDNIGLVGVSAKWSYVTASPSHHDQAIPILSPLLFMHVGHPYIPLFKIRRIFDLLVILWCQKLAARIAWLQCVSIFIMSLIQKKAVANIAIANLEKNVMAVFWLGIVLNYRHDGTCTTTVKC